MFVVLISLLYSTTIVYAYYAKLFWKLKSLIILWYIAVEEFQKFMHGRGVRREQEMNKLEDHVRQSFKVYTCYYDT